jgi:hypothetical protein
LKSVDQCWSKKEPAIRASEKEKARKAYEVAREAYRKILAECEREQSRSMAKEKKRGPRGGVKHQPGRGHQRKSERERKRLFQRKAQRARAEEMEKHSNQWQVWDKLTEEQQKFRPDLRPERPRDYYDH